MRKLFLQESYKKRLMTQSSGHAQIAQSVEQGIENPRVPGSIPGLGTIFRKGLAIGEAFFVSGQK